MDVELRALQDDDRDFVLSLAPRFAAFPLPPWRTLEGVVEGIAADLRKLLDQRPADSFAFIALDPGTGRRLGFIHLQKLKDFFTGDWNCHISDVAVAKEAEGAGLATLLLEFAESWGRDHGCARLTLGVFEGNKRAQAVYARHGFGTELLRMVKPLR